jgi:hypothetical protein
MGAGCYDVSKLEKECGASGSMHIIWLCQDLGLFETLTSNLPTTRNTILYPVGGMLVIQVGSRLATADFALI